MKIILCLLALVGLAACSAGNVRPGSKAQIGDYNVNWVEITPLKDARPDGLTSLMFQFSFASQRSNGLTEADWAQEAQLLGTTVEIAKRTIDEQSAYKTKEGRIGRCYIALIDKGICGRQLNLTVAQRAQMAEALLSQGTQCKWVGFDPSYNQFHAYRFGAASHTLHVRADC